MFLLKYRPIKRVKDLQYLPFNTIFKSTRVEFNKYCYENGNGVFFSSF